MSRTFNADVCTAITKSNSHRFYSANLYIPDQVECIASEVFQKKRELSTASLKNIGARAFQGCSALSSVDLPQQVEDIGPGVFSQCSSLEKVSLSRAISSVPKAAFRGNYRMKNVSFSTDSRISTIRSEAFFQCSSLTSLVLPENLSEIDSRAFYKCKNLENVFFPKELDRIGRESFSACAIRELLLPDSITYIDDCAFFKCKNLTHVVLPKNLRYIGKWVFHGCPKLKYLEIRHDPDFIGPWIINRSCTIRCYKGSKVDAYCQENGFQVEYL